MSTYEELVNPAKLTILPVCHEQPHPNVFAGVLENLHYVCHRIVGCRHRKMSVPFTRGVETYRACLRCGMHRHFDLAEWRMKGRYYNDACGLHARVKTNRIELVHQQIRQFDLEPPIV